MKVILLDNIKGFGQIGDVKNVSDGYARNFLFPRKAAKAATPENLKEVDSLKNKLSAMQELDKKRAAELAESMKDLSIEFTRKATKTGKLFAAIDPADIVKKIKETSGAYITEDMVKSEEPIKKIGEHSIELELTQDIKVPVKVMVKAE